MERRGAVVAEAAARALLLRPQLRREAERYTHRRRDGPNTALLSSARSRRTTCSRCNFTPKKASVRGSRSSFVSSRHDHFARDRSARWQGRAPPRRTLRQGHGLRRGPSGARARMARQGADPPRGRSRRCARRSRRAAGNGARHPEGLRREVAGGRRRPHARSLRELPRARRVAHRGGLARGEGSGARAHACGRAPRRRRARRRREGRQGRDRRLDREQRTRRARCARRLRGIADRRRPLHRRLARRQRAPAPTSR